MVGFLFSLTARKSSAVIQKFAFSSWNIHEETATRASSMAKWANAVNYLSDLKDDSEDEGGGGYTHKQKSGGIGGRHPSSLFLAFLIPLPFLSYQRLNA